MRPTWLQMEEPYIVTGAASAWWRSVVTENAKASTFAAGAKPETRGDSPVDSACVKLGTWMNGEITTTCGESNSSAGAAWLKSWMSVHDISWADIDGASRVNRVRPHTWAI